jgi:TIR domain
MPRITISYRRDDSIEITGRIFDRLAAHFGREAVYRDIDNIPPGTDFRRHVDQALDKSSIVLAIVGPRWIGPRANQSRLASTNDPVRIEVETALRKEKPLIPVLVSQARMPRPDQLPESLQDFAFRNAVQLDPGQDFDIHIGRLIRAIEQILGKDEERAAKQALHHPSATIKAAAQIGGSPAADEALKHSVPEPGAVKEAPTIREDDVPQIIPRTRWTASRLVISTGVFVALAMIAAGGWWVFVEQPAEMARREAVAAEKARAVDQQAAATAKALQEERDRQAAAAAAKAEQDERDRQAAVAAARPAGVTHPANFPEPISRIRLRQAVLVRQSDLDWDWIETDPRDNREVHFHFEKISTAATELTLYDKSRDMYARLNFVDHRAYWRIGAQGPWNWNYDIVGVE